jgi:hypothetical protein
MRTTIFNDPYLCRRQFAEVGQVKILRQSVVPMVLVVGVLFFLLAVTNIYGPF